ncbi:MAG TPA: alpha/beta fold hydrolase [Ramlibacter sp.]|jgi:pimeloyl-ACP methyl ester carboxylesterase|uniref:esterase/lipase family protein n=1 Tax=Ramlibacter sp. TaxID=1917967 RepID=UPI002D42F362|nr:alpha/beta fold hydrolase [Ramlibacter sp.]HZY18384.1 alpha/beta fold hydrolase [Ramlibacter sp.]
MTPVDLGRRALGAVLLAAGWPRAATSQPAGAGARVGIVLMHGIGGSAAAMASLADRLRQPGWSVANLDMPWSQAGAFAQPVEAAERQVLAALDKLRREGAERLVLAGFSLGGLFAAHMAGRARVDGLVAIAPNGGSDMKKLDDQLARARELIAQGRGNERTTLDDADVVSPARWPIQGTVPAAYVTWYDPQGTMNWGGIWSRLRPGTPVLLVVPTRDLANLRERKQQLWQGLPPHPGNRLYEPRTDHLGAPRASAEEAVEWIRDVVAAPAAR